MKILRMSALAIGACLVLSACAATTNLTYTLTMKSDDPAEVLALINAAEKVVTRKLGALETKATVTAVPKGGSSGELSVDLADGKKSDDADRLITAAFTIDIRTLKLEAEAKPEKDLQVDDWLQSGITTEHFMGVRLVGNKRTGEIGVELRFTPAGTVLLQQVFAKHKGKNIGVFVRGLLVSMLKVESDLPGEHIVISGIPSPTVAQVFVDDVNTGLKVTFTRVQQ